MPANDPNQTISEIRHELTLLLKGKRQCGPAVGEILQLLDRLRGEIEAVRSPVRIVSRNPGPRKPGVVKGYSVEPGQRGDHSLALCEHRSSGAQPFRCPRRVYDAVVIELLSARGPVGFTELHRRVNKRLGERAANYLVRMCLRFWVRENIVTHRTTQFEPTEVGRFAGQTRTLWESLAKTGPVARH